MRSLIHKNLAAQAPPSPGARAVRFEHRAVEQFHWDRREQAVMAELMLRGRQTAGEIRNRASRMSPLPDMAAVSVILEALKVHDPPFVEELPREPGRSANRFRHLLAAVEGLTNAAQAPEDQHSAEADSLLGRVANLESEVAMLKAAFAGIMKNLPSDIDVSKPPVV